MKFFSNSCVNFLVLFPTPEKSQEAFKPLAVFSKPENKSDFGF